MSRKILAIVIPAIVLALGGFLLFGPVLEEPGCACLPPPTLEEIKAQIEVAEKGDTAESISATGWVWSAYGLRQDSRNAEIWRKKAIEAGDPDALRSMASNFVNEAQDADSLAIKSSLLTEAISLLEKAYPNRALLVETSRSVFADQLRGLRATLAVLSEGKDGWLRRADAGDVEAAYGLSQYYYYAELDQKLRSYWTDKAVRGGDLQLSWNAACCWRKTRDELIEGKRIIERAKAANSGRADGVDPWIEAVHQEDLDKALFQINRRLAALYGE